MQGDEIAERVKIERIARVCHMVNRAYCRAIGDYSHELWADAPEWQRESAKAGVKLHLATYVGPQGSHDSWMKQKVDDGWVYGAEKDEVKKTHPCILPFSELPPEQRAKDYIFEAIVIALKWHVPE